jgi:arylformamidase
MPSRSLAGVALVVGLSLAAACSTSPEASPAGSTASTTRATTPSGGCLATGMTKRGDVRYRDPASLPGVDPSRVSLDVYQPTVDPGCPPTPMVLWVHGGGWRRGDKRNALDDKIQLAQEQGWSLLSVNYRLTPEVAYPVFNDDVAAAVGWAHEHAAEIHTDPARLALLGHSSGAAIVSAVGTDESHLRASGRSLGDVDCVVSLDTEGYDVFEQGQAGTDGYAEAFGSDPSRWRDASPIDHVAPDKDIPRFLVVTRGAAARRAQAQRFVDALDEAGVLTELVNANPLDHEGVDDAVGAAGDTVVTPPVVSFLNQCFG